MDASPPPRRWGIASSFSPGCTSLPSTYVLVHGAWHGGWCWARVAPLLRAKGHQVFCPTLTGLGERAHLLSREVDMSTHVADVLGLLEAEELTDVILAGHSYGGMVITGVAAKAKARLRQLVYFDAAIVEDGESWSSAHTPEAQAERRRLAQESSGGLALPVPEAEVFGVLDPQDIAWVQRRMTPHPFAPYDQKVAWGAPAGNGLPRVYVDCTEPVYAGLNGVKQRYRGRPDWPFIEVRTGHDLMVSAPGETARVLLEYP